MTYHRSLGVKLIAGYFCLKAAMLPIAAAIAYVASDEASHMNGADIVIDGATIA